MASTYSTNLALELIGTGDQSGTWGTTTNTNLGTLIEQAISGYVTQAITDGADTTITIPNGATGVARNMAIEMTGALTAARNLIVPSNKKLYFIYNNTTGGYAVTVKVSGQTGVSVPNGKKMLLVSNGTDIVEAVNAHATLAVAGVASFADGTVGTPGLNFSSDTDSGIYRIGANNIGIGVNGAKVLDVSTTGLGVTGTVISSDGTVSLPAHSFSSDTDNGFYRIGTNNWAAAVAGAKALEFNPAGEITMPLQPAFLAYNSTTRTNVTGDATDYDVPFDTGVFDQNSDFNTTTGVFTAPVTGKYLLNARVLPTGFGGAVTNLNMKIATSNRTYNAEWSGNLPSVDQQCEINILADMDSGDTAKVVFQASKGGSKTVNVYGNGTSYYTTFSGHLAA